MNLEKEKLEQVRTQLKKEFDGIDEIINQIINIMSSWNSNASRPIVVPIFGMTGTGKTSLITRMIELLGLEHKTYPITLGTSTKEDANTRPAAVLLKEIGFYEYYEYDNSKSIKDVPSDSIIIVDEVQKLRTKDEDGNEIATEFDDLFQILDNGQLKFIISNASEKAKLEKWIVILSKHIATKFPDAIVEDSCVNDPNIIDEFSSLRMIYDNRKTYLSDDEDLAQNPRNFRENNCFEGFKDFSKIADISFELINDNKISIAPIGCRERLRDILTELLTLDEISLKMKELMKRQTLKEYCDKLSDLMKFINSPHYIDFSGSIIFLIGNLDEAFQVSKNLDPDVDANLFHELTKGVNLNDIKCALSARFRPEQIARFGSNYVIYPSFSKETFKKIIKRNFEKNIDNYTKETGIKITYDSRILDLLYSEGVFPTQGTRPVLSTVNAFGIMYFEVNNIKKDHDIDEAYISIVSSNPNFKADKIQLSIKVKKKGDVVLEKEIFYNLNLGKLRNPANDEGRYLKAVHELGHAIMEGLETGKLPSSIITTSSSDSGGFCMRNIEEIQKKRVTNIEYIKSDIKIALGGWVAERKIFQESYCSLGSSSDISNIWNDISYAYYKQGYLSPVAFCRGDKPDGVPNGLDDPTIMTEIKNNFLSLKEEVEDKIEKYVPLIADMAQKLGDRGSFSEEEFRNELINLDSDRASLAKDFLEEVNRRLTEKTSPEKYLLRINEKKNTRKIGWLRRLIERFKDNLE